MAYVTVYVISQSYASDPTAPFQSVYQWNQSLHYQA